MYCVYGNSGRYIHASPLFGGGPLLGGFVIGGSTVDVYSDQERNRESQLPSGVEPRPSDQ